MRKRKTSVQQLIMISLLIAVMAGISIVFILFLGKDDGPDGPALSPVPTHQQVGISESPGTGNSGTEGTSSKPPESGNGDGYTPSPADPSPSPVQTPPPSPSDTITLIDIAEINSELISKLDTESNGHNSIAVSIVAYDGYKGLYYAYQYGYADREAKSAVNVNTKFRIASLSKFIVAICAMKLVDEGKLDIDEDISVYLGYNVRNPNYPSTPITARMLMQHSSSIYDSDAFHGSLDRGERNATQKLLSGRASYTGSRPGGSHLYTNFGIAVLGAVVEMASGKKLDEYAREVLFKPLDIDAAYLPSNLNDTSLLANIYSTRHTLSLPVATQLRRSDTYEIGKSQSLGYGSLVISAFDYAKILAMLGNGGLFLGERILSPESVAEIHNADFKGPGFMQGLSTRFTNGGKPENNEGVINDILLWLYTDEDGESIPSEGIYWHTGSAWGLFAQYIYIAGSGTDEGRGGVDTSRGVVVITTGARTGRASNGMIDVGNHLSAIAWQGLEFDKPD